MKVDDVFRLINKIAPFSLAEEWDNVGLLVGNPKAEVTGILVTLDVTPQVLLLAGQNNVNLLVSHHPVIFSALKTFTAGMVPYDAARRGISIIAAHTNYDKAPGGINDILARALGISHIKPIAEGGVGCAGRVSKTTTPAAFAKVIEQVTGIVPRYNPNGKQITQVGVCGGCGADMMLPGIREGGWGYQAFVTADVKHHEFLEADAMGITLFDAGHYATEVLAMPPLAERLAAAFPMIPVAVADCYKGELIG